MNNNGSSVDSIFNADGTLKRPVKLSEAFLRPAYQYTKQEIRNWQREGWEEEFESNYKEREINS